MNRRSFLKTSAAVTAGTCILPQFSIGKPGPSANSKLNVAIIGASHVAHFSFDGCVDENIVGLCDVDSRLFGEYQEKHPRIKDIPKFTDFRVMLDKLGDQVDAVCINTPDHTHFVATMEAMHRGKHVFTQKPLTHNVWQARTLRKAKHKYKVVTNMGNQGHTFEGIRWMREWYEADVFGQITEVHSWAPGPDWNYRYFNKPESYPLSVDPVAPEFNYDLWLGPIEKIPYHKNYHPRTWRGFKRFGTGTLGDWFCHIADAPVWILDLYEPVAIELEEIAGGNDILVPDGCRIRYDFEKRGTKEPCSFYWYNGPGFRPEMPEKWTMSKELPEYGTIYKGQKNIGYTDARSSNPRLVNLDEMRAFNKSGKPEHKYPTVEGGPVKEWIRAIKGEGPEPGSNFDYAAPMTEVMLLGLIAVNHGGKIEWDSKAMKITNRPELNACLKEPARKGWVYGEDLWT